MIHLFIKSFFSPGFYITQKVMNLIAKERVELFKIKNNKQTNFGLFSTEQSIQSLKH